MRRSAVVPYALNTEALAGRVDEFNATRRARKVPTIQVGGVSFQKRTELILDAVDRLYAMGREIRVLTTTLNDNTGVMKDRPYIETRTSVSQSKFFDMMGDADVFVDASFDESLGAAYWEQLASGQICVFIDEPWLAGLLPSDYPFVTSPPDLKLLLKYVVENIEEARAAVATYPQWAAETFGYGTVGKRWATHVKAAIAADRSLLNGYGQPARVENQSISEAVGKWAAGVRKGSRMTLDMCRAEIVAYSDSHLDYFDGRLADPLALVEMLKHFGMADACDGPAPVFVKE